MLGILILVKSYKDADGDGFGGVMSLEQMLKEVRGNLNNWAYNLNPILAMPIKPRHALAAI